MSIARLVIIACFGKLFEKRTFVAVYSGWCGCKASVKSSQMNFLVKNICLPCDNIIATVKHETESASEKDMLHAHS
eukprot:scaffold950_cov27-Prasinocladus_malaysianus.AAC.1